MRFRSHELVCLLPGRGSPPEVGAAVTIVKVSSTIFGSHCLDALSTAETESSLLSVEGSHSKMSFSGESEGWHRT